MTDRQSSSTNKGGGGGDPRTYKTKRDPRFDLHYELAPPRPDGMLNTEDEREVVQLARDHLYQHSRMLADRPTFNACLENRALCRFPDIVCYDETRYIYPKEPARKFYHAQSCDGFVKADAYLVAQAPFNKDTRKNFWQMCCFERPAAIVLMDDVAGQETAFVEQFWPNPRMVLSYPDERGLRFIEVGCKEHLGESADGTFHAYSLHLMIYNERDVKRVETTLYVMRPDPSSVPSYIPHLRLELHALQRRLMRQRTPKGLSKTGDTIVLVCGDGCTKGGSFVAYDVIMDRATKTKRVGLKQTVKILRLQCYGAVHSLGTYKKLHVLLLTQLSLQKELMDG